MIQTSYVSPSEQRALMATIDGSQDAATATDDELDAIVEQDYDSRSGFELACAFRNPDAFEEGGQCFGLHPAHARQMADFHPSTPIGWAW